MGWPKPSRLELENTNRLEGEFHYHFNYAVPFLRGGLSEVRVIQGNSIGSWVLVERQLKVIGAVERIQRVIQEVNALNPELQVLRFADLEVLEQRHIPAEVAGTVHDRK